MRGGILRATCYAPFFPASHGEGWPEGVMRVTIKPLSNPGCELDVTHALVAAVSHQLWEHCGGDPVRNWLEAEQFVARLATAVQSDSRGPGARSRRAEGLARRKPRRPEPDPVIGPIPNYFPSQK